MERRRRRLRIGPTSGRILVTSCLIGGLGVVLVPSTAMGAPAPVCSAGLCTVTFHETGAPQSFTVATGIESITATADGAQGGGVFNDPGTGRGGAGQSTWTADGGAGGNPDTAGGDDNSGDGGKGGTGATGSTPGAGGTAGLGSEGGNGSGGGSSFSTDPMATFTSGTWSGAGEVTISYATTSPPPGSSSGYWLLGGDGGVFAYGSSGFFGSGQSPVADCPANPPARSMPGGSCWSMTPTADGQGYWMLNAYSGKIYAFGDAVSYGQPADTPTYGGSTETWPTAIDIVATPSGKGYWVLEEGQSGLGSVQAFGDAVAYGDESTVDHAASHVGAPVGMASTPDGKGYWIVDSDGGVFSFGDAAFAGSMGGTRLNAPVIGVAATGDGGGYWLAASDGGVFAFGDATFGGSMATTPLVKPVIGIAPDPSGSGYWLAASDGGVFALGGASFLGSMGSRSLNAPVFAISARAVAAG
jgi:hypothetical protein